MLRKKYLYEYIRQKKILKIKIFINFTPQKKQKIRCF
jgi:hypothetical protein